MDGGGCGLAGSSTGHDHRGGGRAKSRSESRPRPSARTDTTRGGTACRAQRPQGPRAHSGWRERGDGPEEALRPCRGSWGRARPMRILGNGVWGGQERGRQARRGGGGGGGGGGVQRSRNSREVHAGRSRGGEGRGAPPGAAGPPAGRALDAPASGPRRWPARRAGTGAELPSSPCGESLAPCVPPGWPRAPAAPSLAWGCGG